MYLKNCGEGYLNNDVGSFDCSARFCQEVLYYAKTQDKPRRSDTNSYLSTQSANLPVHGYRCVIKQHHHHRHHHNHHHYYFIIFTGHFCDYGNYANYANYSFLSVANGACDLAALCHPDHGRFGCFLSVKKLP